MPKIEVKNLTKIFGGNPKDGLKRLQAGEDKTKILKETGMTIGVDNASFQVKQGE
ncbi:ABC transporter ATP-binding protein, partial [Bacillus circulans]|nr:ABC transporter ATP-binding protein [Niallia circulans]